MLSLIQISDCHLAEDLNFEKHGVNSDAAFNKLLAHIRREAKPDLIIASGDIAEQPSQKTYKRFFQSLEALGCPVLTVPGNHDDQSLLRQDKCRDLGGWQFIALDSNSPAVNQYGGFLAQGELDFLQRKLKQSDKPTVVILHHPPLVPENNWLQEVRLENADELIELIEAYPQVKAVLSGHVHYAYEIKQSGIEYLSCPSTYRQFDGKAEKFAIDKALKYGYRKLDLDRSGAVFSQAYFIEEVL